MKSTSMKIYIVTADDEDDSYPEKAFSSREKAQAYFDAELEKAKAREKWASGKWRDKWFNRMIVELDIE